MVLPWLVVGTGYSLPEFPPLVLAIRGSRSEHRKDLCRFSCDPTPPTVDENIVKRVIM